MKSKELLNQLKQYQKVGLLHAIDVEFTTFLFRLKPDTPPEVLLGACLTSYFYRQGNVCLELNNIDSELFAGTNGELEPLSIPSSTDWKAVINRSEIVGSPGSFTPLILDSSRLYLQKLWKQEQQLGESLLLLSRKKTNSVDYEKLSQGLSRLFPVDDADWVNYQKIAAAAAVLQSLTVISGGPGTGKTTTVVRVLALLLEQLQPEESFEIALAAPTGKAAARLKESIEAQKTDLDTAEIIKSNIPEKTFTIHRLLGARRDSESFKHNEENKLPHDLIVVDEASMADQRLIHHLLQAMKPAARLILLGDKDQLASVEAGSVFGDICGHIGNKFSYSFCSSLEKAGIALDENSKAATDKPLSDNIILLEQNFRFGEKSGISGLTLAIKKGEAQRVIELLQDEARDDVTLKPAESFNLFWQIFEATVTDYFQWVKENPPTAVLFKKLQQHIILCAHRKGPFGVEAVNYEVEKRIRVGTDEWYEGRPVIIRRNDYQLQLRNGDIGICHFSEEGEAAVVFPAKSDNQIEERKVHPERLPQYDPAFALTIHQSQGSEFDKIFLVLPNKKSKILTRELLYTAVTRTKEQLTVFGREQVIREVIGQRLTRHSGLEELLKGGEGLQKK